MIRRAGPFFFHIDKTGPKGRYVPCPFPVSSTNNICHAGKLVQCGFYIFPLSQTGPQTSFLDSSITTTLFLKIGIFLTFYIHCEWSPWHHLLFWFRLN